MNTGDYCFFWNARSFVEFAFSRHEYQGFSYVHVLRQVFRRADIISLGRAQKPALVSWDALPQPYAF